MMKTLIPIPFTFTHSGIIRALLIDDEPWFVVHDIAKALEYHTVSSLSRLVSPSNERLYWLDTRGGRQPMVLANRAGLNDAMMRMAYWRSKLLEEWLDSTARPKLSLKTPPVFESLPTYSRARADSRPVLDWLCTQPSCGDIKASLSALAPEQLNTVEDLASRGLNNSIGLGLPYPRLLEQTAEQVLTFVKAIQASRGVVPERISA